MKNDLNQGIVIGSWKTNTIPNDLEQIKQFLKTLKQDLINLTIITHSKKKHTYQEANYRLKNQTLFVDPQILEEMKQTKITLINDNFSSSNSKLLLSDLTPLKSQNNSLKHLFNIFQINYKNEFKNIIKELIGKINLHKLENLQLYQLEPNKLDKYNNPIKTNYKKGLNVVYYRQEDLKYIQFFLTKTKQGYRVKKIHPKYKYISQDWHFYDISLTLLWQFTDSFMTLRWHFYDSLSLWKSYLKTSTSNQWYFIFYIDNDNDTRYLILSLYLLSIVIINRYKKNLFLINFIFLIYFNN